MVEPQIVILVVAGSSPVDHPIPAVHVDSRSTLWNKACEILLVSWKCSNLSLVTPFVIVNC